MSVTLLTDSWTLQQEALDRNEAGCSVPAGAENPGVQDRGDLFEVHADPVEFDPAP